METLTRLHRPLQAHTRERAQDGSGSSRRSGKPSTMSHCPIQPCQARPRGKCSKCTERTQLHLHPPFCMYVCTYAPMYVRTYVRERMHISGLLPMCSRYRPYGATIGADVKTALSWPRLFAHPRSGLQWLPRLSTRRASARSSPHCSRHPAPLTRGARNPSTATRTPHERTNGVVAYTVWDGGDGGARVCGGRETCDAVASNGCDGVLVVCRCRPAVNGVSSQDPCTRVPVCARARARTHVIVRSGRDGDAKGRRRRRQAHAAQT
jgi:hypothetical protein